MVVVDSVDVDDLLYKLQCYNEQLIKARLERDEEKRQNRSSPRRLKLSLRGVGRSSSKSPFFRREREPQKEPEERRSLLRTSSRSKSPFFRREKETPKSPEAATRSNSNIKRRSKSPFFRRVKEPEAAPLLTRITIVQETNKDAERQEQLEAPLTATNHHERNVSFSPPPPPPSEQQHSPDHCAALHDLSLTSPPATRGGKIKNPCKHNKGQGRTAGSGDGTIHAGIVHSTSMTSIDELMDMMDKNEEKATRKNMVLLSDDDRTKSDDEDTLFTSITWNPETEIRDYYTKYQKHGFAPKRGTRAKTAPPPEEERGFFEVLGRNIDDLQRTWCSNANKARRDEPPVNMVSFDSETAASFEERPCMGINI